jgi:hypothetical protein
LSNGRPEVPRLNDGSEGRTVFCSFGSEDFQEVADAGRLGFLIAELGLSMHAIAASGPAGLIARDFHDLSHWQSKPQVLSQAQDLFDIAS